MAFIPPEPLAPGVSAPPCTPDGMVGQYPCLACLSEEQLFKLLAFVLYALQNGGSTDVDQMLEDGKCFKCLNQKEALRAIVGSYISLAVANGYFADADAAVAAAWCLNCVDPKAIMGILLDGICDNITANWPQ